MKKVILLVMLAVLMTGRGSLQRFFGDLGSDIKGGVDRKATLYSNDGKVIQTWEGRIDLSGNSRETYMLMDGKRTIIHGGIMVVEEK